MIREAAALRVPAYSIFGSKIGSVDKFLAESGRMYLIRTKEDVRNKIRIEKRLKGKESFKQNKLTLNFIVDAIIDLLNEVEKAEHKTKGSVILNRTSFIYIALALDMYYNLSQILGNCAFC